MLLSCVNIIHFGFQEEDKYIVFNTDVENMCIENGIDIREEADLLPLNEARAKNAEEFMYDVKNKGIKEVYISVDCPDCSGRGAYWVKEYNAWTYNGSYVYEIRNGISSKNRFLVSDIEHIDNSGMLLSRNVSGTVFSSLLLSALETVLLILLYLLLEEKINKNRK